MADEQKCHSFSFVRKLLIFLLLSLPLHAQRTNLTAEDAQTVTGPKAFTGGITNIGGCAATNGSQVVGNGTSFACQSKPVIDVRDLSVTASGDQASNITSAWNSAGPASAILFPALGNVTLGSSVAPNPFNGYSFEGVGGEGEAGGATKFNWTGGASPAFKLDQQRDSIFGRMLINLNGTSGAGGVLVSQLNGFSAISSHNFYHDIQINGVHGSGGYGFRIIAPSNDSANNNEGHTLWRIGVSATSTYDSGTSGIFLGQSANARNIGIYESEPVSVDHAFDLSGGSWHVIGGLTEQSNIALNINLGAQGGTYAFVHDESSKQGINSNGISAQYNYLFLNNTYEMDSVDLTKNYWDLSGLANVVSVGNIMKPNASVTKMVAPPSHSWYSLGDILPNGTIANLPNLPLFPRAITIGTSSPFTGGNFSGSASDGGIAIFTISKNNQTDDNDSATGPVNALWMGPSEVYSFGASQWYSSPGMALAATYNDGSAVIHQVPFRYKVLLTDATGTSAATWKLLPPTDPVTGTTYAGVLNFDYATNGNNFSDKNHIAATYKTAANCQLGGASGTTSPAACGAAPAGKIAIPSSAGTSYTVNTSAATANSEIIVQQTTDNSGLPSSPTCNTNAEIPAVKQMSRSAGTSFTLSGLSNPAAITCFEYWIVN